MKKLMIRKLGVGSVAKFVGTANAILVFIQGVFLMVAGIIGTLEQSDWNIVSKLLASVGVVVGSLVVLPLIGFLFGWLYGAVVALIANLFLQTSNGLEVDVEEQK